MMLRTVYELNKHRKLPSTRRSGAVVLRYFGCLEVLVDFRLLYGHQYMKRNMWTPNMHK